MTSKRTERAAVAALALVHCAPLMAHETWLYVESGRSDPAGGRFVLGATSGMGFPKVDGVVDGSRLEAAHVRCPEGEIEAAVRRGGALRLEFTCKEAGWASAEIRLAARELTLDGKQVEGYFEEIQADATLRAQWRELSTRHPWRERYRKHARVLLLSGSTTASSDWPSQGQGEWQFQPLGPGADDASEVAIRLVHHGAAVSGQAVLLLDASGQRRTARTDGHGEVRFVGPIAAPALVYTTILRWSEAERVWQSDFVTLSWH